MDPQQETLPVDTEHEHVPVEKAEVHEVEDFKKIDTLDALAVDPENRRALKGDDSDGRIDWTLKQVLATLFLSGLYVGKFGHKQSPCSLLLSVQSHVADDCVC